MLFSSLAGCILNDCVVLSEEILPFLILVCLSVGINSSRKNVFMKSKFFHLGVDPLSNGLFLFR